MPANRAPHILPALMTLSMVLLLVACGGGGASPVGGGPGRTGLQVPRSPAGIGSTATWTYTATGLVVGNGQTFNLTGSRTVAGDIGWTGVLNGDELHLINDDQSLRVVETGQTFSLSAEYVDHFDEEGRQWRYGVRVGGGSIDFLTQPVLIAEASMGVGDVYGPLNFTDASGTQHSSTWRVTAIETVHTALGSLNAYRMHTTGTVMPIGGPISTIDIVTHQRPDMGILTQTETITQPIANGVAIQKVTWEVQTYQSHGRSGPAPSGVGAPDVAIFFVSGHRLSLDAGSFIVDGKPEPEYLSRFGDGGPFIHQALEAAGYSVNSFFYSDNATNISQGNENIGPGPAFPQLVSDLSAAASAYGPSTQIVVIAHSHGCISSHAALRDLDATLGANRVLLVDLDGIRLGFDTTHGCAAFGGCTDTALNVQIGIQNIVYPCVEANFEIRSGGIVDIRDLVDNMRHVTGATNGIETHAGVDTHSKCHRPGYSGIPMVVSWLKQKLSD